MSYSVLCAGARKRKHIGNNDLGATDREQLPARKGGGRIAASGLSDEHYDSAGEHNRCHIFVTASSRLSEGVRLGQGVTVSCTPIVRTVGSCPSSMPGYGYTLSNTSGSKFLL